MTALPLTIADRIRAWRLDHTHTECDWCKRSLRQSQVRTTLYAGKMCYLCTACLKGMRRG